MKTTENEIVINLPPVAARKGVRRGLSGLFGNEQTKHLHVTGGGSWKKHIPLSREDAVAVLTRDLPSMPEINLTLHKDGSGSLEMKAAGLFHYSDTSRDLGAPFDLAKGMAGKGRLVIEDGNRAHGTGRTVRRNLVEFFRLCGVQTLNIHAGYAGGGYTWARFGDFPDTVRGRDFESQTKKPANDRYRFLRPYLGEEDRAVLDNAVAFDDPHDIWLIADREKDISPVLRPLFNSIAANVVTPETSSLLALFQGGHGFEVLAHFRESLNAGRKIPVGEFLLAGTSWRGHLDMNDPEQMHRAGNYAGGWRYIGFSPSE